MISAKSSKVSKGTRLKMNYQAIGFNNARAQVIFASSRSIIGPTQRNTRSISQEI